MACGRISGTGKAGVVGVEGVVQGGVKTGVGKLTYQAAHAALPDVDDRPARHESAKPRS